MFLLVPAYLGSPGQKAVKLLCVCVCFLQKQPMMIFLLGINVNAALAAYNSSTVPNRSKVHVEH